MPAGGGFPAFGSRRDGVNMVVLAVPAEARKQGGLIAEASATTVAEPDAFNRQINQTHLAQHQLNFLGQLADVEADGMAVAAAENGFRVITERRNRLEKQRFDCFSGRCSSIECRGVR